MKSKTINVYNVDELSDKAKEHALYKWLEGGDYFWATENRGTLDKFEKIFPITVKNFEYGGTPGFVSWSFDADDNIEELSGQRLATYIWNNYRREIFQGKYYGHLSPLDKHGNKIPVSEEHPIGERHVIRHSRIILEHSCVLTGFCMDESILMHVYQFLDKPDSRTFKELIQDCIDSWLKDCETDYEYSQSMESFIESCEANEYEFDEDGDMV